MSDADQSVVGRTCKVVVFKIRTILVDIPTISSFLSSIHHSTNSVQDGALVTTKLTLLSFLIQA